MSILETGLDDTGHIRKLAEEDYQARRRPVDAGGFIVTAAVAVAVGLWAFPAFDNDRFAIDATRWAMAAAASGAVIAALVCGFYVLDRRNRTRHDEMMAHVGSLRPVACHNASAIGQLSAEMEQINGRLGWLVTDRRRHQAEERRLPVVEPATPPTADEVEQMPMADVHELAKDVWKLARRQRPAGND